MQDYNINVRYDPTQDIKPTNPMRNRVQRNKTQLSDRSASKQSGLNLRPVQKSIGVGLGIASKINSYVGSLTENTIQQRNISTALTYAGIGVFALSNPITAGIAATVYTADRVIKYQIKQYKANLSAGFMERLSGGVYTTRK